MGTGSPGHQRKWREMTRLQKIVSIAMAVIQLSMAGAAWRDLARRPGEQVRGPKWRWALVIGLNFFGPIAYFRRGRIQVPAAHVE